MPSKNTRIIFQRFNKQKKTRYARLNIKHIDEIFNLIDTTELTMIEQMKQSRSHKKERFNDNSIKASEKIKNEFKNLKYCKFHQSNTHSNEECRQETRKQKKKTHTYKQMTQIKL